MASPIIRTTYALDVATVERLDRLARGWGMSRSAALRKAARPPFSGRPSVGRAAAEIRLAATRARSAQGASKLSRLVLETDAPEARGRLAAWKRLRGSLSPAQTGTWRRQLRLERAASDPDRRRAR